MKKLLLIISLLLYLAPLNSQEDMGKVVQLTPTADSLINVLASTDGRARLSLLIELAEETRLDHPDIAEKYIDEAQQWIDEKIVNSDYAKYLVALCGVRLSQYKFDEALAIGEKVLSLQYSAKHPSDYFDIYMYMGTAHNQFGDFAQAQEAFYKGLQLADSLNYSSKKSGLYNSIGIVYQSMKDTVQAEKNLLKAIQLAEENNQPDRANIVKSNLAVHYTNLKQYDKAEMLLLENVAINKKNGELSYLGNNYNNLGVIYHYRGEHQKSLEALQRALEIAQELEYSTVVAVRHMNVGEAHLMSGNYKLAESHILQGVQLAKEIKSKEYLLNGLVTASKLFEGMGKHETALQYYKDYTALNDSMLNENRIEVVAELQEKYETEKKEKEILSLSNENVLAERKLRNLNFTVFGLCFGLLGLGMFLYFLRQNHRKNNIISKKNLQIASDKIVLLERENEITKLASVLQGQENERERLAKELHDGLGGLLAISHSTLSNLEKKSETNGAIGQATKLVGDAYQQVRQISHNLMPLGLEKFGLVATLQNLIDMVDQQNNVSIDFRTYHFNHSFNNEVGLNVYRIVQEALTNILKYAQAENVLIELIQHDEMISITIEDDGQGFNVAEHSTGVGVKNMRNRTELLKGTFDIDSKLNQGTTISVQIPFTHSSATPSQT